MRVLQVINTLAISDGGPARYGYELHLALEQQPGVVDRMFVMRRDDEPVVYPAGLAERRGPGTPVVEAAPSLGRLLRAVRGSDAVVVHGYYLWWLPVVALIGRILRRRVLLTPHGSFTRYKQRRSRGRKLLFDRLAGPVLRASVDAVALGSPEEVEDTRAKLPWARISVCGVGTAIPDLPAPGPDALPRTLLSVSRLHPGKRVDLMVEALGELRRRGVPARLLVAGTGPEELVRQLRALAVDRGVADAVDLLGQIDGPAKEDLYRGADLFLALSDDENFGISAAEALAHGLAVVASAFVPAAAGVPPTCGRILTDRSPEQVAEAVVALLGVPKSDRFVAARHHAGMHFGWGAVAERWLALARS